MVCSGANRTSARRVAQPSLTTSPTCRRLAPDFALFPTAIGLVPSLSFGPAPKSAKSAASVLSSFSADTLGGRVHKSPSGPTSAGRLRTDVRKDDGFQSTRIPRFGGKSAPSSLAHHI